MLRPLNAMAQMMVAKSVKLMLVFSQCPNELKPHFNTWDEIFERHLASQFTDDLTLSGRLKSILLSGSVMV